MKIYAQADVQCEDWRGGYGQCDAACTCKVELRSPHDHYGGRSDLAGLLEAGAPELPEGWGWIEGEARCPKHLAKR